MDAGSRRPAARARRLLSRHPAGAQLLARRCEILLDGPPRQDRAPRGHRRAADPAARRATPDATRPRRCAARSSPCPREDVCRRSSEGEYWARELAGCVVVGRRHRVGEVRRMLPLPSCEALEVARDGGGELLVPMVRDAIRAIDVAARGASTWTSRSWASEPVIRGGSGESWPPDTSAPYEPEPNSSLHPRRRSWRRARCVPAAGERRAVEPVPPRRATRRAPTAATTTRSSSIPPRAGTQDGGRRHVEMSLADASSASTSTGPPPSRSTR